MPARRLALAVAPLVLSTACMNTGALTAAPQPPLGAAAVATSAAPVPRKAASTAVTPTPLPPVTVGTTRISAHGVATVAQALLAAHVRVPGGRYLAVVDHVRLGSDHRPGHVLLNGRPAGVDTAVHPGDAIAVVPGRDHTESTETVTVPVEPPVTSTLYVGTKPGVARIVRGRLSGEEVSRHVVVEPTLGHLVTPGAVALTFDDGPDPRRTPQVLGLLARAHVHATFCLIGENAAAHPDLVRALVTGGDTLCDHTWDHDERLPSRGPDEIRAEIARAYAAIVTAAGTPPLFFRAPGGNWSTAVEAEARAEHLTPLRWTVDPRDWSRPGTEQILRTVYAQLRPGGVILLHDGGGDRSQTLAAFAVLLDRLPAMGYRFVLPPTG